MSNWITRFFRRLSRYPVHPKDRVTLFEKKLLFALADMVNQHCDLDDKGVFDTGFIRCNKDAMELLVDAGVMEEVHPELKQRESPRRNYDVRFVDNWKIVLYQREIG